MNSNYGHRKSKTAGEYILHLWQLEDLLRALQFSPEAIFSTLIAPRKDIGEEQKHVFLLWYMDLANLLRQEGKEEKGHLEHTLHLIQDLHDLHLQLMKLPVGAHYRQTYARLEPELPRLRSVLGNPGMNDTELCFRALYAAMLYRGRQIGRDGHAGIHIPRNRRVSRHARQGRAGRSEPVQDGDRITPPNRTGR